VKKPIIVAVALAAFALPATALALTTSDAKPTTISLSGANGVTNCTRFPYTTTAKLDVLAQITISLNGTKVKSLRATNVAAGNHTIRWCGKGTTGALVAPGVYTWHIQTRHYAHTPGLSPATPDRKLTVIA
jgi:flagellar hook assembly protein FlgD